MSFFARRVFLVTTLKMIFSVDEYNSPYAGSNKTTHISLNFYSRNHILSLESLPISAVGGRTEDVGDEG